MLSSTEVFPWLFLPPITVRPFSVGSIFTALIRLTFSSSSELIFTIAFSPNQWYYIGVLFYLRRVRVAARHGAIYLICKRLGQIPAV